MNNAEIKIKEEVEAMAENGVAFNGRACDLSRYIKASRIGLAAIGKDRQARVNFYNTIATYQKASNAA